MNLSRSLAIYSLLLAAALGLAYKASLPRSSIDANEVEWARVNRAAITEIQFKSPTVTVTAKSMAKGFWIDYHEMAVSEGAEDIVDGFRASARIEDFLKSFQPLVATRVLAAAEDELAEFGLDKESAGRLVVRGGERDLLTIRIGRRAFGSRQYYVYDEVRERVLIVDGREFEAFEKARNRLYERELSDLVIEDVTHVEIGAQAQVQRIERRVADDGNPGWGLDREGAEINDTFANWLNRVLRLRVVSFLQTDELAMLEGLAPFLETTFERQNKTVETFRFLKKVQAGGEVAYFVQTSYLGRPARLSVSAMDQIDRDIANIMVIK